ncbi:MULTISPECIES: purine-cytosine permease family protein [unclassified Streptomyces]|uniref:purine-cytosine permease family protein n=1 Tax=unclassified Streptomyces TaxID=2593676 RepID=UPI0036BE6839
MTAPAAPVYGDAIAKVEPFGTGHIPDHERHGTPRSQFFVWFAAGLNFPIVVLGFAATGFGLSLGAAIVAILLGALVGSALVAMMSRMGVRLGVPQQVQARGPLGYYGNFLPVAYVNVFAGIGWAAVTAILGGKAFAELTGVPFWLCALALLALQAAVCVYGYNMINSLQRVLAYVLTPLFVLITVVALVRGGGAAHPARHPGGSLGAGGWITFAGWFLAFLVAWAPFASDYSRYLPDTPEVARRAAWYTGLGNFVTISWLGTVGVLVGSGAHGADPIVALHRLAGPFAAPALIAIAVSAFAQNFLNIYGSALSLQTLRVPVSRVGAVVCVSLLTYGVVLWGAAGTEAKFVSFLNLTTYFIAPFVTVLILHYLRGGGSDSRRVGELYDRGRVLEWGIVAWAGGVLAAVPFWSSRLYTGPLAAAHPGWGDLSMFVAAAVAAVLYLALHRLPPLWTCDRGPSDNREAPGQWLKPRCAARDSNPGPAD